MTRHDYITLSTALAQAYSEAKGPLERAGVILAASYVASALEAQSRGFDRERFIADVTNPGLTGSKQV
jgi:hypothetical protein